jgi:BASS family bile acid:Na+ symporter
VHTLYKGCLVAAGLCAAALVGLLIAGATGWVGPVAVGVFAGLALGVRVHPVLGDFTFTLAVFASVAFAMFYPGLLDVWWGVELTVFIVPLIQIIMFGMGASLSVADFARVIQMPKGVLVGVVCQYSIMPLVGVTLAMTTGLPDEIAAGIVLIGSAPGGVASNVMAYISESNLALSVTLTAVSTLLAPVMTPFLMEGLAGQFVPVAFFEMMWSILEMIILPVALGLLFNRYFHGKAQWLDDVMPIVSMGAIAVIIAVITAAGQQSLLTVGPLLVAAAVVHNAAGYLFGYWGCRLLGMSEQDCRTVSFEVGMQNGGLASGLAVEMGKVATVGLAPAIFGPWMNITGSGLANYWRRRALETAPGDEAEAPAGATSPAAAGS